jgi:hypothetical protein
VQRGGRGQAHHAGQFDVRPVGIRLQRSQQFDVNIVKFHSHTAEYYLAQVLNRRIFAMRLAK